MAIKTNHPINLFTVNTIIDKYPIKENVSVFKGELLYFYT